MARKRIIAVALLTLAFGHPTVSTWSASPPAAGTASLSGASPASVRSQPLFPRLSVEQDELVGWALSRFFASGLELPPMEIEFFSSTVDCMGRKGLYYASESRLRMCSLEKKTMLHELAHAWVGVEFSANDRQRFMELRELSSWNDRDVPWEQRGTEHAAEILTWGLMDEPTLVRWVEDGIESFRLLSIPNSDVESLAVGFEVLTGLDSPHGHTDERPVQMSTFSPEVATQP